MRKVSPTFTPQRRRRDRAYMLRSVTDLPLSVVSDTQLFNVTSSLPPTDESICGSTKVSAGLAGRHLVAHATVEHGR
jgi:hypothetical protein